MTFDRDLNVAVVTAARALGEPVRSGWEMLAATGVRGLRLVAEAGPFDRFLFTEGSPVAVRWLEANVARTAGAVATVRQADARNPASEGPFDYVDLDPYGTPMPFVEAAIASLRPPGLLAVTATDTRVLAGVDRGAAETRYGGHPVRGRLGPEGGLRLLLAALDRQLEGKGKTLRPRLAYVGSHHVRAYVSVVDRIGPSPIAEIDPVRWDGPLLPGTRPVGPLWLGPLFDGALVAQLHVPANAQQPRALDRWIGRVRNEATVDRPFFYEPNSIARLLELPRPPAFRVLEARLRSAGYRAVPTHARAGGFRTDAPRSVVLGVAAADQPQNERVRA